MMPPAIDSSRRMSGQSLDSIEGWVRKLSARRPNTFATVSISFFLLLSLRCRIATVLHQLHLRFRCRKPQQVCLAAKLAVSVNQTQKISGSGELEIKFQNEGVGRQQLFFNDKDYLAFEETNWTRPRFLSIP